MLVFPIAYAASSSAAHRLPLCYARWTAAVEREEIKLHDLFIVQAWTERGQSAPSAQRAVFFLWLCGVVESAAASLLL